MKLIEIRNARLTKADIMIVIAAGFNFSSTGQRPASYCHGVVSVMRPSVSPFVCPSVHACVRKLLLQKTSPQKLLTGFL